MRKNCFAKKLMAYTMAFAVAFSTVTVSPLFVKEAKAETNYPLAVTAAVPASADKIVNGSDVVLGELTTLASVVTAEQTVTDAYLTKETGIKNIINGATLKEVPRATSGEEYITDYELKATLGGNNTESTLKSADAGNTKAIVFDGMTRKETGADPTKGESAKGNKKVTLSMGTATNGTAWFKLTKDTTTFTREYTTVAAVGPAPAVKKSETITVPYFTLKPVHDTVDDDADYVIEEVTQDDLGLYLGVVLDGNGETTGATTYKLFNLYEESDMVPAANQGKITASVGGKAKLEVAVDTKSKTRTNFTYTWTKAGSTLDKYTSNVIEFNSLKDTDFGTYYCTVNDGLKNSQPVQVKLEKATVTASITKKVDATSVKSYAKVLTTDGSDKKLVGGAATFTSSIPKDENYRYIWTINSGLSLDLTENDEMNHSATDNFITYTPEYTSSATFKVIPAATKVTCYVVDKTLYNETFAPQLTAVANASANTKYAKLQALRGAEMTVAAGLDYLYKEEFNLIDADDTTKLAETKFVGIGDTLTLTAPTVKEPTGYTWNSGERTETIKRNTVGIDEFGQYVVTSTPKIGAPVEKTYNVIYKSDLTASGSDVTAKLNSKVELKVEATASLPISFGWKFKVPDTDTTKVKDASWVNGTHGTQTDTATSSIIEIAKVVPTNYVVAEKKNTSGEITNAECNYYVCKVSDGIIDKYITIKVNKDSGFEVYDDQNAEYVDGTDTITQPTTTVIKDRTYTFKPDVKLYGDTKVTYTWKVSGKEVATTDAYTYTYNGSDTKVVCEVTDGTNTITVEYDLTNTLNLADPACKTADNYKVVTENKVYDAGNELKGVVKVTDVHNNLVMVEGVDYEVVYKENINVGIARAEIKLIGQYKDIELDKSIVAKFFIDRAENDLVIAGKTVNPGESVLPTTVKNPAKAALTYTYYSDLAGTTEIAVPKTAGVYYVKADSVATTNYNAAESKIVKIIIRPAVAKNFKLAARGTTSLKMSWSKVSGAKGYRVYKMVSGKWTRVAETANTYYTFSSLKAGTTYKFAVKPYLKDGSTAVWAKTYTAASAFTKPGKVAGFKVASKTRTSVKTTWKKTTGATSYNVYKVVGKKWVKVATVKGTSYTFKGLKKNTTYKFAVKAYKSGVAAASYPTVSARTAK